MNLSDRLKHSWNAFMNKDPTSMTAMNYGPSYSYRPDRVRLSRGNEKSIVTSVYNRIAIDAAGIQLEHVRLDTDGCFIETMNTTLNDCLTIEANADQTGRALIQDIVMSMEDEGCIAIVPTDISVDPSISNSYNILSLRVGKILEWKPAHVKVRVYNENTGKQEDIWVPKKIVAIVENPLYAIMNEPNSTMQRLIRKLNLLDVIDEQSGAGKLDLLIQLPYIIKSDARRQQAETRRKDIETQLTSSKYGIAYTDGTERVTQLNRPVENNLMKQIEYLTSMLYSQLGLTTSIMDGTADDTTMNNYYTRTIEPILSAIVDEMKRKFLTKTARTQGQSIRFFRDPFKLVPVSLIPDMADKLTRNEIFSSNEMRQKMGAKPSKDPNADELRNKNLNQKVDPVATQNGIPTENINTEELEEEPSMTNDEYKQSLNDLDNFDSELDELEKSLGRKELTHYASEYYDPAKAHEYYERTKELKSTSRLNDEGKSAAKYVKEQLSSERKSKVAANQSSTDSQIQSVRESTKTKIENERNSMKADVEMHMKSMQSDIDRLTKLLNKMTKAQKEEKKEEIYEKIDSLREDNNVFREELKTDFKSTSDGLQKDSKTSISSLREGNKATRSQLKEEYDQKYADELSKIKLTKAFQKVRKARKSGATANKDPLAEFRI